MAEHPALELFEAFVAGQLHDGGFERHVSECDACAARLCAEARVEVASRLLAGGRGQVIPFGGRVLRGRGYLMGLTLAVAASMLLFFHAVTAMAKTPEVARPPAALLLADGGTGDGRVAEVDGGRFQHQFVAPCDDCGPRD